MSGGPPTADFPHMGPSGSTWRRDEGQTMAEYAVVLGLITPIVVLALITLGNAVVPILGQVTSLL